MSDRCLLPIVLLSLCLGFSAIAMAEDLADPTRPPQVVSAGRTFSSPAASQPSWELQAILVGDERRIAVINGRSLAEKGRLGPATVVRIEADKVLLRYQDKIVTLKLRRVEGARKRNLKLEGKLNP